MGTNPSWLQALDRTLTVGIPGANPADCPFTYTPPPVKEKNISLTTYDREDIYEISDEQMESIPSSLLDGTPKGDILEGMTIPGPPSLQRKITSLVREFADIFSQSLSSLPAKVAPFRFTVNKEQWENASNSKPPRKYDKTRTEEIKKWSRS